MTSTRTQRLYLLVVMMAWYGMVWCMVYGAHVFFFCTAKSQDSAVDRHSRSDGVACFFFFFIFVCLVYVFTIAVAHGMNIRQMLLQAVRANFFRRGDVGAFGGLAVSYPSNTFFSTHSRPFLPLFLRAACSQNN